MTDSREFNASTVEEALAKASEDLEVSEENLSYEILDEGSGGFLGIGARDARVSVVMPSNEEFADEEPANEEPLDTVENVPTELSAQQDEVAPLSSSDWNTERDYREEEVKASEPVEAPEELIEEIRDHVSSVVEAMGLRSRVDVYDTEDYVAVDIASDHTALIIGQKGETIDSLQYLVNSAIYRDRAFVKRIVLDSEGYRQRRIEAIQGMAYRTARKSAREQRDIEMPPMTSAERRVVHVYLKDNPGVTTFSKGTGNERSVTVSPE